MYVCSTLLYKMYFILCMILISLVLLYPGCLALLHLSEQMHLSELLFSRSGPGSTVLLTTLHFTKHSNRTHSKLNSQTLQTGKLSILK